MDDARQIAEKLTEAQRRTILSAYDPARFRENGVVRLRAAGPWRVTNALFDLGLTNADEWLTPLGEQVKRLLEEEQQP